MSYNILKGGEERLPLILDVIRAQAPDVVALQEANNHGNIQTVAHELGMQLVLGEANTKYCVAWLSRLPILRSENHTRPAFRKSVLEIEVAWQGAPLRLFAAHLRPRITGEELRVHEMDGILEILHAADGQPHLLVGDMNTFHPDDVFVPEPGHAPEVAERVQRVYDAPRLTIPRLLSAGYVDCYRTLHPDQPGYTFATRLPMARIDYIFAPVQMASRLRACDIVYTAEAVRGSDHFPIWAEFV